MEQETTSELCVRLLQNWADMMDDAVQPIGRVEGEPFSKRYSFKLDIEKQDEYWGGIPTAGALRDWLTCGAQISQGDRYRRVIEFQRALERLLGTEEIMSIRAILDEMEGDISDKQARCWLHLLHRENKIRLSVSSGDEIADAATPIVNMTGGLSYRWLKTIGT